MDLLLIFLSIAGAVFAGGMLLLASRTTRMERESDARVDELVARATGPVLFASEATKAASVQEIDEAPLLLQTHAPAGLEARAYEGDLDLAWEQMVDEKAVQTAKAVHAEDVEEFRAPARYPFVLNRPATAASGQVFSFARAHRRSRT